MTRSGFAAFVLAVVMAAGCAGPMAGATGKPFNVVETAIPELQKALADGRVTSRQLVVE